MSDWLHIFCGALLIAAFFVPQKGRRVFIHGMIAYAGFIALTVVLIYRLILGLTTGSFTPALQTLALLIFFSFISGLLPGLFIMLHERGWFQKRGKKQKYDA
jgi:hypothetical protein